MKLIMKASQFGIDPNDPFSKTALIVMHKILRGTIESGTPSSTLGRKAWNVTLNGKHRAGQGRRIIVNLLLKIGRPLNPLP